MIFRAHPRTMNGLDVAGLSSRIKTSAGLRVIEPLGYLDFIKLMADSAFVLTDSGGIQEETTVLGIPCLTLRENTERPISITHGTNRLAGTSPESILTAYREIRDHPPRRVAVPKRWDGPTTERIVARLVSAC